MKKIITLTAAGKIIALFLIGLLYAFTIPAHSQSANVLTYHNDNSRSGVNPNETVLNTTNVNLNTFGLVNTLAVNSQSRSQPLYVSGLTVQGHTHNVVYVTSSDTELYAFDADSGVLLWSDYLGAHASGEPSNEGILATPVIDAATSAIYVTTYTNINGANQYSLHAIDLATGVEDFGGPKLIMASVPSTFTQYDAVNGIVTFAPDQQDHHVADTLANGIIYMTFASQDDIDPWHGWVIGYDQSTLNQVAVWCSSPDSGEGGIWQSGEGLAADTDGDLYCITGNGDRSLENNALDFGESFVRLQQSGTTLSEKDYFKENNYDYLNSEDGDLGAGGAVIMNIAATATTPAYNYLVGGGKQGKMFLVNTANMGGLNLSADQVVQEWQAQDGLWGAPVFLNGATPTLYVWGKGSPLYAYAFNTTTGLFDTAPVAASTYSVANQEPGAMGLSISTNGSVPGSAIVWATNSTIAGYYPPAPAILHAFDARNLNEIWNSTMNQSRDGMGIFARETPPTIANGKVYVNSWSNKYYVYGILPTAAPAAAVLAGAADSDQVDLSWNTPTTATSYAVYRSVGNETSFVKLATVSAADTYVDPTPVNGTTYYYQVVAANSIGSSSASNTVVLSPLASSGTAVSVTSATGSPQKTTEFSATLTSNSTHLPLAGETLTFNVDGIGLGTAVTNASGVATMAFPMAIDFAAPTSTITVAFAGQGVNSPSTGYGLLTTKGIITAVKATAATGVAGLQTTLTATLTANGSSLPSETIMFSVDGSVVGSAVTSSSGVATLDYTIPSTTTAGSHVLTVAFDGDIHYAPISATSTLTVSAPSATTITASPVAGAVGSTVDLTGTLTDGTPAADFAGQTVDFAVNGSFVGYAITNASGVATLPYTVTSGTGLWAQYYSATFAPIPGYLGSIASGTFTATAIPTTLTESLSSSAADAGTLVNVTATLGTTAGGYQPIGRGINFFVDGSRFAVETTTAGGVATATYSIPAGESAGPHTVQVSFTGDDHYSASSASSTLTVVTPKSTSLTASPVTGAVGSVVSLTGVLTSNGSPVSGVPLAFTVNGGIGGTATTNASGVATFSYTVTSSNGVWTQFYNVYFAGNTYYTQSASSTTSLAVTGIPTTLTASLAPSTASPGQTISITATLLPTNGNVDLSNRGINFYVGGTRIAVSNTNPSGVATTNYTIPANEAAASLPVSVTFTGDAHYTGSSASGAITVQP